MAVEKGVIPLKEIEQELGKPDNRPPAENRSPVLLVCGKGIGEDLAGRFVKYFFKPQANVKLCFADKARGLLEAESGTLVSTVSDVQRGAPAQKLFLPTPKRAARYSMVYSIAFTGRNFLYMICPPDEIERTVNW